MSELHVLWSNRLLTYAVFSDARLWNTVYIGSEQAYSKLTRLMLKHATIGSCSLFQYTFTSPGLGSVFHFKAEHLIEHSDWIPRSLLWSACLTVLVSLSVLRTLRCWMPIWIGSGLCKSFPGSRNEIQRPTLSILLRKTFNWRSICVIVKLLSHLQKTTFLRTIANYQWGRITMKFQHR